MGKKIFLVDRPIKMKSSDCFDSAQWLTVAEKHSWLDKILQRSS